MAIAGLRYRWHFLTKPHGYIPYGKDIAPNDYYLAILVSSGVHVVIRLHVRPCVRLMVVRSAVRPLIKGLCTCTGHLVCGVELVTHTLRTQVDQTRRWLAC